MKKKEFEKWKLDLTKETIRLIREAKSIDDIIELFRNKYKQTVGFSDALDIKDEVQRRKY